MPIGTGLAAPLGAARGGADVARHSESRVGQRRNRWLALVAISAPAQTTQRLSQPLVRPHADVERHVLLTRSESSNDLAFQLLSLVMLSDGQAPLPLSRILLPCALLRGSGGAFPRARAPAKPPTLTARRWLRSRSGRASPSSTVAALCGRVCGGAIAGGHTGGSPLRWPPRGRADPSASRPSTCLRGARRRSRRGRSLGQSPRIERRRRGSATPGVRNGRLWTERTGIRDPFQRDEMIACLLYTSPSPRDKRQSRMPSSA